MRHLYYKLIGHKPVPADTSTTAKLIEWANWFETHRPIRLTRVGPYEVSTVFLGIDHAFYFSGPPILFETMVKVPEPEPRKTKIGPHTFTHHHSFLDIQRTLLHLETSRSAARPHRRATQRRVGRRRGTPTGEAAGNNHKKPDLTVAA